jgi:hypothetical protein
MDLETQSRYKSFMSELLRHSCDSRKHHLLQYLLLHESAASLLIEWIQFMGTAADYEQLKFLINVSDKHHEGVYSAAYK